jgi:hypothetical protein
VAFPTHLGEVVEMAKYVRNAIFGHQLQVGGFYMTIDLDLVYLSNPPSFVQH